MEGPGEWRLLLFLSSRFAKFWTEKGDVNVRDEQAHDKDRMGDYFDIDANYYDCSVGAAGFAYEPGHTRKRASATLLS